MFIKRDEEEHILCIPENMLGREFGVLLDAWVVFGIGKTSSLSSSLMSLATITLSLRSVSSDFSSRISSLSLSVEESSDCGGASNSDSLLSSDWLHPGAGEVFQSLVKSHPEAERLGNQYPVSCLYSSQSLPPARPPSLTHRPPKAVRPL